MSFAKMVRTVKKNCNSVKVLVFGLDNAGKTTLLNRYLGIAAVAAPTFGYKIFTKPFGNYTLHIYDIGGQTSFKKYWNNYFEDADAIVYVIDSSDSRPIAEYLHEICGMDVPIAVFCNKIDVNPGFSTALLEEASSCKSFKCFKTSAVDGTGVLDGFNWVVQEAAAGLK